MEIEDNKDRYPKRRLRASRRKRKATPSKVKDDGDIGSDAGIAPATVIRKTRLRAAGKKPIKAASPKVRAKKAPVTKAKTSKLKIIQAKQQNTGSATSHTTVASSSKTLRKRVKVNPNGSRITAPNDKHT